MRCQNKQTNWFFSLQRFTSINLLSHRNGNIHTELNFKIKTTTHHIVERVREREICEFMTGLFRFAIKQKVCISYWFEVQQFSSQNLHMLKCDARFEILFFRCKMYWEVSTQHNMLHCALVYMVPNRMEWRQKHRKSYGFGISTTET